MIGHAGVCRPLAYRRTQLLQLARLCQDNADALSDAIYADLGKPRLEFLAFELGSIVERCLLCAENLEEWSAPECLPGLPERQSGWAPTVYKNPKGPVLAISPWNYPAILSFQPLYAAISAGCPAVIKPSELVPAFSNLVAQLLPRYLDPRAYAVVNGAVPETTKLLELRWAHVFYTGNGRVGRLVAAAAARHLTPVSLELGGKSPALVDPRSDLRIAARRILHGKSANAGQTCVAPDYVLIPRSAQPALVAAFREAFAERYPDGALASDSYGRVVNAMHFKRVRSLLSQSKGEIVLGGDVDEARLKLVPTVVADVKADDALMQEEIFGPVLPIVPVEDLEEAIDFINEREHPLAFYAFTNDPVLKQRLVDETLSGSLIFNDTFDQLSSNELPFTGVGESGYGYQVMKYGFDEFTHHRASLDVPAEIEPHLSVRYPPYTSDKLAIMSGNVYLPIPPVESNAGSDNVLHL
ncbi:hypothetical protein M0805_005012 [Coniferiporia weirii]|nr:hypothetical protein M0805_005012 [Coniferiporia weirii]